MSERLEKIFSPEKPEYPKSLFHVSAWPDLRNKQVGDVFLLEPGTQHAEGRGTYFSEHAPRPHAADGVQRSGGASAIIVIDVASPHGWWRSKKAMVRKHQRPRTWHTNRKRIRCSITKIETHEAIPYLYCTWKFV